MNSISREAALRICSGIRADNRNKIISFAKIQCWGCQKYSKGDEDLFCFNSKDGNHGCHLINNVFDMNKD